MKLNIFRQEEFFEEHEFSCRHMLALSGVQPLTHAEVMETGERVKTQFVALLRSVIPRIAESLTQIETPGSRK